MSRLTYEDGLLDAQRMANEAADLMHCEGRLDARDALLSLSTDLLMARNGLDGSVSRSKRPSSPHTPAKASQSRTQAARGPSATFTAIDEFLSIAPGAIEVSEA